MLRANCCWDQQGWHSCTAIPSLFMSVIIGLNDSESYSHTGFSFVYYHYSFPAGSQWLRTSKLIGCYVLPFHYLKLGYISGCDHELFQIRITVIFAVLHSKIGSKGGLHIILYCKTKFLCVENICDLACSKIFAILQCLWSCSTFVTHNDIESKCALTMW